MGNHAAQPTAQKGAKVDSNQAETAVSPTPLTPESPQQMPLWADTAVPTIQFSLKVNPPNDKYEQEADRVATQVMRMPDTAVQRKSCACGKPAGPDGMCADCKRKKLSVQRLANGDGGNTAVPPIVNQVIAQRGQPLDTSARNFMESRFKQDFSHVRIHTNAQAHRSTQAVNARAYTVGQNIAFESGQYAPNSSRGRQLLAHELTHVIQQRGVQPPTSAHQLNIDTPHSSAESEAQTIGSGIAAGHTTPTIKPQATFSEPTLSRADPDAVSRVGALGRTIGTGIQFFPTNLTDTVVGPVSVQGGLRNPGANRLNVIIGENLTPRILARQLLPLWTTATPFTPPSGGPPVPLQIIDDETLAKGLLVYNRFYLPVPAMRKWRSGLRFPLPVEIDATTGVGTLHPSLISRMAGAFDPAWTPLLDARAAANATSATLVADVTAFLQQEPTALARGMHLEARALTNASAELPFIQETFRQLGADGFNVALEFMKYIVNRQIELLAAQRDGAAILAEIQTALGAASPAVVAAHQAQVDRANLMLGRVAATVAVAPPTATRTRPEKTVTVDTLKLVGSTHNPATQIAVANAIFSQCNVRIVSGVSADDSTSATPQTTTWLGGDTDIRTGRCSPVTPDQRRLFRDGSNHYGLGGGQFSAFFVATATGTSGGGYSCPRSSNPHALFRNKIVVLNSGSTDTLAHELGHHLINPGSHRSAGTIMAGRPRLTLRLTDRQCNRIYSNA